MEGSGKTPKETDAPSKHGEDGSPEKLEEKELECNVVPKTEKGGKKLECCVKPSLEGESSTTQDFYGATSTSNPPVLRHLSSTESFVAEARKRRSARNLGLSAQFGYPASSRQSVLPVLEELIEKEQERLDKTGESGAAKLTEETSTLPQLLRMYHTRKPNERNVLFGIYPNIESKISEKGERYSCLPMQLSNFEEMLDSDAMLEHTLSIQRHKVIVNTFHPDFPEIYLRLPQDCLVGELKHRVKAFMGLKSDSIDMFGFFEGMLGSPIQHIPDDRPVQLFAKLCFVRLSFQQDYEFNATHQDPVALQLLYYELVHMIEREKLTSRSADLKKALRELRGAATPEGPFNLFVQRVRCYALSYWTHYYHSCFCIVQKIFKTSSYHLNQGECLHIGLNMDNLILFDDKDILCFFNWNLIHLVKHCPDIETVKFHIWVDNAMLSLELRSQNSDYIFSIAMHVIKLLENRASIRSSFRKGPDLIINELVFWNDTFKYLKVHTPLTRSECQLRVRGLELLHAMRTTHRDENVELVRQLHRPCPATPSSSRDSSIMEPTATGGNSFPSAPQALDVPEKETDI